MKDPFSGLTEIVHQMTDIFRHYNTRQRIKEAHRIRAAPL